MVVYFEPKSVSRARTRATAASYERVVRIPTYLER
jgi:hypothetical protein